MSGGDGRIERISSLMEVDLVGTFNDELFGFAAVGDFEVIGHFE